MQATIGACFRWAWVGAIALLSLGCSGGSNDTAMGSLRVALTDAPSCGFDAVNITVISVRVHASQTADENGAGWQEIVLPAPRQINLLGLANGVLEELGQRALPSGQYTQLRLMLQPNRGANPANSVVPTGGSEQPLDTPSAIQSGIKLIRPFTVPAGGLADLVLDFDACKSVVVRGNGTYGLKPVVSVAPRVVADVIGFVDPALAGVRVTAQRNGIVLRAVAPDASGAFRLAFLDPAAAPTVDVVIVAPGRATAVIGAVPIAMQGTTSVSTSGAPIALPASVMRTASGSALPASAIATVRALQAVNGVPKVEVASANVDMNGVYTLSLPAGAPLFAAFGTLPLTFSAQTADAGLYTLEATADGYAPATAAIDVTNANVARDLPLTPVP